MKIYMNNKKNNIGKNNIKKNNPFEIKINNDLRSKKRKTKNL